MEHTPHMGNSWDRDAAQLGWPLYPEQYYDLIGARHHPLEGEQALMLAVLRDGLQCYLSATAAKGHHQRRSMVEVEQWINADEKGLFSFVHLCEAFNINPGALRQALKKIKADPHSLTRSRPRLKVQVLSWGKPLSIGRQRKSRPPAF